MRIAVIGLRGFPNIQGGVESHCENIMPRLALHHDIIVYRRTPYVDHTKPDQYQAIKFIDLPSTRIKGVEALLHTFLAALHIILHRNADVVNIHNIGPGLFTPLLRLFGFKVVLTYHSPNYEHSKWGWFSRKILKLGEYLSLHFASRVIFVNSVQLNKFSNRIKSRSTYIPNGIKKVCPSTHTDYLDSLGINQGRYILAVGRLTPEKGFETLIRAVNSDPAIPHLVIAGGSDHSPAYKDTLASLDVNNKVTFTGFVTGEPLRQLYSNASLFVLSSMNEGFPIVLLEAMTYNVPAIVTDIPGTQAVDIPADHRVPAGNADKLASAIIDHYRSGVTRQQYPGLEAYDWDNIVSTTESVYNSLQS